MDSMDNSEKEVRKYDRLDTEVKIYFEVNYEIKTRVDFEVVKAKAQDTGKKHSAISKNVSAEGICFASAVELKKDDCLRMEVFLPGGKTVIDMEGKVCWSRAVGESQQKPNFDTGVKLMTVNGKSVLESIYFDKEHRVIWSVVLESVLGNFRKF